MDRLKNIKVDGNTLTGASIIAGSTLLMVIVILGSALNIYNLVLYLRPGDYTWAMVAPLLFDGSALVWLGLFIFKARGGWQRLIAGVWCVAAVAGTIAANVYYWDLTSAAYWTSLTLASPSLEQLRAIELDKAAQSLWAMRYIEFAMAWLLIGKFAFILADPGIRALMREQVAEDQTLGEAAVEADAMMQATRAVSAKRIAERRHANMLDRLGKVSEVGLGDLQTVAPIVTKASVLHGTNGHGETSFTQPPNP